jgi:hypothetical protein
MGATSSRRHSQLKQTWLRALRAGAGSLVIATAVVGVPPADAALSSAPPSIEQRVQRARETLRPGATDTQQKDTPGTLAFWGNRIGVVGVRPVVGWPNWPNWNNWHNWGNYGPGWGNF